MQIVVSPHAIEVVPRIRALRAFFSSWVFDASRTRFEVSRAVAPRAVSAAGILPREWIVLTTMQAGKTERLAITAGGAMEQIWSALSESGAGPTSSPP